MSFQKIYDKILRAKLTTIVKFVGKQSFEIPLKIFFFITESESHKILDICTFDIVLQAEW